MGVDAWKRQVGTSNRWYAHRMFTKSNNFVIAIDFNDQHPFIAGRYYRLAWTASFKVRLKPVDRIALVNIVEVRERPQTNNGICAMLLRRVHPGVLPYRSIDLIPPRQQQDTSRNEYQQRDRHGKAADLQAPGGNRLI